MLSDWSQYAKIEELVGKILTKVNVGDDIITFETAGGSKYEMYHEQDCCESVWVEDINGDLSDLIDEPILMAEKVTEDGDRDWDSMTWTFYKIGTTKGVVTIRWCGVSNGYYSEEVDFICLTKGDD